MKRLTVQSLTPEHSHELERFFLTLSYQPTDWDQSLSKADHGKWLLSDVWKEAQTGNGYVIRVSGEVQGIWVIVPHQWNTQFFQVPCAQVTHFYATSLDAAMALSERLREYIVEHKLQHVYVALEVRERWGSLALQRTGWRVTWASMKVVCNPSDVDTSSFNTRQGDLEVVPHEEWHLPHLLEIAGRLTDYSWLQWEERLLLKHRHAYLANLTRNCCTTGFANFNYTLLEKGVPIGHISSTIVDYPPEVGSRRFAYRRNIFVDPRKQSIGHGKLLALTACKYDKPRVDLILGRVRMEGAAMFRMLESVGFHTSSGELYHVFDG